MGDDDGPRVIDRPSIIDAQPSENGGGDDGPPSSTIAPAPHFHADGSLDIIVDDGRRTDDEDDAA